MANDKQKFSDWCKFFLAIKYDIIDIIFIERVTYPFYDFKSYL